MMVHARLHVLIGCLARLSFSIATFLNSFSAMNGPFFALLLMLNQLLVASYWSLVPRPLATSIQQPATFSLTRSPSADAAGACRTCGGGGLTSPTACAGRG